MRRKDTLKTSFKGQFQDQINHNLFSANGLSWSDPNVSNLTPEDGLLHVCPDTRSPWKPKKGRDRFVPVHEEALKELLSLRKPEESDDDYILPVERPPRARSRNRVRAQRIFKRSAALLDTLGWLGYATDSRARVPHPHPTIQTCPNCPSPVNSTVLSMSPSHGNWPVNSGLNATPASVTKSLGSLSTTVSGTRQRLGTSR